MKGSLKRRLDRIKQATLKRPYIFYFIGIFISYIILNSIINKTYETFSVFSSFALWFKITYSLSIYLIIPLLVALTVNLSIMKFKELRLVQAKEGGATFLGLFGGILGGACPGCFVGLFPAVLGLFGITASLSVLPLLGFEIQMASAVFLIVAITFLTRDTVCKVDFTQPKK